MKAHGPAQDSIDEACKTLVNGYRCAELDGISRGESCQAHSVEYTPYNFFSGTTDLTEDCELENMTVSQCAVDACIIEGSFTLQFFGSFFTGGINFDSSFSHADGPQNQGTFDPITTGCPILKTRVSCDIFVKF